VQLLDARCFDVSIALCVCVCKSSESITNIGGNIVERARTRSTVEHMDEQQLLQLNRAVLSLDELYGMLNVYRAAFIVKGDEATLQQAVDALKLMEFPAVYAISDDDLVAKCADERYRLFVVTPEIFARAFPSHYSDLQSITLVACLTMTELTLVQEAWQTAVPDAGNVLHIVSLCSTTF
jgi:hypothetical protein